MTEPNVLGNISPAKFLFESGNTEIINLWRDDWNSTGTISLMQESAGTLAGQTYVVPANRICWLLSFSLTKFSADVRLNIQSNTSPDTAVGGTTKARIYGDITADEMSKALPHAMCIKFVAGEYITPYDEESVRIFCEAWGVECDA